MSKKKRNQNLGEEQPTFNVPKTLSEALRLAADQQGIIDEQKKQLEENKMEMAVMAELLSSFAENTLRYAIVEHVKEFSKSTGMRRNDVWHHVYALLLADYGIDIRVFDRKGGESKLDVAQRENLLPQIDAIISSMLHKIDRARGGNATRLN